jgi:DNA mismatch endonuclease, patch repair protein
MDAPVASSPQVRAIMQAIRSTDTRPEVALRRELHRRGLRYRINARPIPQVRRTADIVFTRHKIAVFVDGCFWHGCPDHYRAPSTNSDYWQKKLARNVCRDRTTDELLAGEGWRVIRVWEHVPASDTASRIAELIRERVAPE